jgi:hypothetical protein
VRRVEAEQFDSTSAPQSLLRAEAASLEEPEPVEKALTAPLMEVVQLLRVVSVSSLLR